MDITLRQNRKKSFLDTGQMKFYQVDELFCREFRKVAEERE